MPNSSNVLAERPRIETVEFSWIHHELCQRSGELYNPNCESEVAVRLCKLLFGYGSDTLEVEGPEFAIDNCTCVVLIDSVNEYHRFSLSVSCPCIFAYAFAMHCCLMLLSQYVLWYLHV